MSDVSTSDHLFEASTITVKFGGITALDQVSLRVDANELVGLIGPNGAGKTTLFNVATGFVRPREGTVLFRGEDITSLAVHKRSRLGLKRTFQDVELFDDLTLAENCEAAAHPHRRQAIGETLAEFGLSRLSDVMGRNLPTGLRRKAGVVRALVDDPALLMLDEPGAGLSSNEVEEFGGLLVEACRRRGCGLLLVDHDMSLIRRVCSRVVVLDFGKVIAVGPPEEIESDEGVRVAYLGV